MITHRRFIGIVLAVCLAAPAASAEPVSSPRYQSWAKYKPGTAVARTSEVKSGGESIITDVKQTLLEVSAEKVVVEMRVKLSTRGRVQEAPPQRVEFPAKVEKFSDLITPDIKASFTETRTDTVEILGRTLTCRVIEFTGTKTPKEGAPINVSGTIWVSEDIPDATVQLIQTAEQTAPDGTKVEAVTSTAVAAIDIKS